MTNKEALEITLEFVERYNKQDAEVRVAEAQGVLEEMLIAEHCNSGQHHFVECDEWEPTCMFCGKFQ